MILVYFVMIQGLLYTGLEAHRTEGGFLSDKERRNVNVEPQQGQSLGPNKGQNPLTGSAFHVRTTLGHSNLDIHIS